jgi:hypothetical protein
LDAHKRTFCEQTAVERRADSVFDLEIVEDWNAWVPNGGYLVGCMIRAASEVAAPMSCRNVHANFLRPCRNQPATIEVAEVFGSESARCLRTDLVQSGKVRSTAIAWFSADQPIDLPDIAPDQVVPRKPLASLRSSRERNGGREGYEYARSIDQYDLDELDDWEGRSGLPATVEQFIQWRNATCTSQCACRLGRAAVVADLLPFFALMRWRAGLERSYMAPTMSLSLSFPPDVVVPRTLFGSAAVSWSGKGSYEATTIVCSEEGDPIAVGRQTNLLQPFG